MGVDRTVLLVDVLQEATPASPSRRSWWARLSSRARERVLLGTLVGVGIAARDALLVASAAAVLAALEAADAASPTPTARSAV